MKGGIFARRSILHWRLSSKIMFYIALNWSVTQVSAKFFIHFLTNFPGTHSFFPFEPPLNTMLLPTCVISNYTSKLQFVNSILLGLNRCLQDFFDLWRRHSVILHITYCLLILFKEVGIQLSVCWVWFLSLEDANAFDGGNGMVSALSCLASWWTSCCKVRSLALLSEYPLALIASGTFNFKSYEAPDKSLAAHFSQGSFLVAS